MVPKGHRAELNQVSRTSSSWTTAPPHFGQAAGSSMATVISPQALQYQAGIQ